MTTPEKAKRMGFYPLTTPYSREEEWMLDNVCDDMRRGGISFELVAEEGGIAVWRTLEGAK